jgi:hypothetical protein
MSDFDDRFVARVLAFVRGEADAPARPTKG